jgi:hypothetical protein
MTLGDAKLRLSLLFEEAGQILGDAIEGARCLSKPLEDRRSVRVRQDG